ncbi:hypothetical protein BEL05_15610 [Shewanella colwelliana]|jgi:predicted DNA-binding transcriptional regulator AlpA|uniref:AlpA family phage regulatory protein n=1 Tax=Shewanella colwelliana TaxID=23 RepID=A0A1E5ITJ5_SHECO|nr:hypothetical protein [Shewanella colwelliana]OEG73874.1 hypothetical protein BEL05_15610 [Shewanella colwelliana]
MPNKHEDRLDMYIDDARLVKTGQILKIFDISRTTLWRWGQLGKFPKPALTHNGRSYWLFKDVNAWFTERLKNRLGI